MYKEVTVDPSCMAEFHYYGLVRSEFGFEKGRYLAVSVKEWAREAFQYVQKADIQPVKKKSVKQFLNAIQKAKRPPEQFHLAADREQLKHFEGESWQDWLLRQSNLRLFTAVLSESGVHDSINYEDVISRHAKWSVSPSVPVDKNAVSIVDVIEKLIPFSQCLTIIDPYFGVGKQESVEVLHELFSRARNYRLLRKITLVTHIKDKDPVATFSEKFMGKYESLPKFEVIDDLPDKFIHDRYLIGDKAAIKSGQGFSKGVAKGAASDQLRFNLVSQEEVSEVMGCIKEALNAKKVTIKLCHG